MTAIKQRQASCACGQFRMNLRGDPELVSSCHCQQCQRRTGALFGSTSFWRKTQIVSIEGQRTAYRRQGDSGAWLTFNFCPTCGSSVFWEHEHQPELVSVAVGTFADPDFPPPVRTVWTETKHRWLAFPAGLPHFPRAPTEQQ
jgi:hypothetical protein